MTIAAHHHARQRLAAQLDAALDEIDFALPGSIGQRRTRCGNPRCRCHADPPQLHGPYTQWTRKQDGKTITRLLTPEQAARYQTWIDNARRLRELVRELEALGVQAAEHAEGWQRSHGNPRPHASATIPHPPATIPPSKTAGQRPDRPDFSGGNWLGGRPA